MNGFSTYHQGSYLIIFYFKKTLHEVGDDCGTISQGYKPIWWNLSGFYNPDPNFQDSNSHSTILEV